MARNFSASRVFASVNSIDESIGVCMRTMKVLWSCTGMNSLLIKFSVPNDSAKNANEPPMTFHGCSSATASHRRYSAATARNVKSAARPMRVVRLPAWTNCEARIGVSVSASSSDSITATVMVTPNWKKNLPMTPLMNATGRKIATTASVAATAAKVIWREPTSAAGTRFSPFS